MADAAPKSVSFNTYKMYNNPEFHEAKNKGFVNYLVNQDHTLSKLLEVEIYQKK